jgi:hypothetical protein
MTDIGASPSAAIRRVWSDIDNHQRPHRSLPQRTNPVVAHVARPKATPGERRADSHGRVRHDRVATGGSVTLRDNGRAHR